jgi:hypothetical protein
MKNCPIQRNRAGLNPNRPIGFYFSWSNRSWKNTVAAPAKELFDSEDVLVRI